MFYIPHSVGLIIAVSPKSGSTSIRNDLHVDGARPLSRKAVVELKKSFWKVVGIVRDPIDRLESCYNFFQHKHNGGFPLGKYDGQESFIDAVLNGADNPHWLPQSSMLDLCDRFVDMESYPIVNHINKNKHLESITYRLDDLKHFYKEDFKLRGNSWLS